MRDCRPLLWGLSVTLSLTTFAPVEAQLIPDNTLGKENSIVNSVNSLQRIDGGAIRGSNLFHSFQEFNIDNGKSVYFSNPASIQNILTRITGNNPSSIFGKLGVLGNANLFLINPNGIIFAGNSSLDINGSFISSTADSIKFADGKEFSAINPSANPILTIDVPLGLQYGSNPGNIEVVSSNLQVPDGKSLALIGGNLELDNGNLGARAGRIDLLAVKNGEVSLINDNGQIKLEVVPDIEYGNIELVNATNVDASGSNGGNIQVRGRNIIFKDDSRISTNTEGNGSGEILNITATELLEINASSLSANIENQATGVGSKIIINSKGLLINNGGFISSKTDGLGNGGGLEIKASDIQLIGISPQGPQESGLFAQVNLGAEGNGGDLTIETNNLRLADGAQIFNTTSGIGNAGELRIKANNIEVMGGGEFNVSQISASVLGGFGDGGNLIIETGNLRVVDGGQIAAATTGKGNAGNIQINADLVELSGFSQSESTPAKSGLFASALQEDGLGGNLSVTANQLIIRDRATINASNFFSFDPENLQGSAGTGAAGSIFINSPFIQLENEAIVTANANAGDKGNINIQSQNLQFRQGSLISTNAKNSADGGNINIATNTLVALENSDITANSEGSFGGRVVIDAKGIFGTQFREELTNSSDITATSSLGASFNGVVDINTITVDPSSGLVELPQNFAEASQKIKAGCNASVGNNFIISGRGGLPESPDDLFSGTTTVTELLDLISTKESNFNTINKNSSVHIDNQNNKIVEATGWVKDADGNIIFVAEVNANNSKFTGFNSASCESFSAINKQVK